ncbi:MAG: hypothetical protein D6715_04780 [Calditrichaeota bacterium]|nr:MAG: hypothetical protein D6715_04780 [Calditrichota bacterium]
MDLLFFRHFSREMRGALLQKVLGMKTLFKKVAIVGAATLLLEAIILYFLYNSINTFYADLTAKNAYLLTEQVKNLIVGDKFDIKRASSQYNRYPIRRLIQRFSGEDSKILHVLLIDKNNRIIISDQPAHEGKIYTRPEELARLNTTRPKILNRKLKGEIEILDVIWPIWQDGEIQGYLRTVISVKQLLSFQNFYNRRKTFLFAAAGLSLGIIILTVVFTSRIYQTSLRDIQQAIRSLSETDFGYRPEYKRRDEFAPVYTGLSQLSEKAAGLSESFRQAEEKIKAMMRVVHEGLLIIDLNMNILSYNDYLLDTLDIRKHGQPEDDIYQILQQNPRLLEIYRRSRDPLTHAVRKVLPLKLLNGKTVNVQIHAMPFYDQGQVSGIVLYFKNLRMLMELEQNLHRSMLYGVISQLASSIGHEIRNPLSSLAIHAEILDNMVSKSVQDREQLRKIKKSIKIVNSEIERLHKLIDQFFTLARSREVALSHEQMNDLLNEVLDLVQQQAYEKKVTIHKYFSQNLPPVHISRDQIKQVVLNLVLNAFDAMPGGGDLYLRTVQRDGRVVVSIRDTGQGIPEQLRNHIFDLYFTTKESGVGIGLAISKKIVEAHEGRIYFESKVGEGTIFYLELPVN